MQPDKEPPLEFTEDERKHLEFVQAVVARLAGDSARVKGWSITVSVAAFGFAAGGTEPWLAFFGLIAVLAFALLDAYYLREERLFRKLFTAIGRREVPPYSMDKNRFRSNPGAAADLLRKGGALRSWAVLGFYTPWLVVGAAVLWVLKY